MRAKFAGTCTRCGGRIAVDEEIDYNSEKRTAAHSICPETLNLYRATEAQNLADRLGWIKPGDPIPKEWITGDVSYEYTAVDGRRISRWKD